MSIIAGYARISSRKQGEESLERQKERIIQAGAEEGYIFTDIQSGKKTTRNGYRKLMTLVRTGSVSRLIVTRRDRLNRTNDGLLATIRELQKWGVDLVAIDQPVREDSYGRLLEGLMGLMGEFEVNQLSERVRSAQKQRRSQGLADHAPFGYIISKLTHKIELDKEPFLCLLEDKPLNWRDGDDWILGLSCYDLAKDLIDIFFKHRSLHSTVAIFNNKYRLNPEAPSGGKEQGRKGIGFSSYGLRVWLFNPVLQGLFQDKPTHEALLTPSQVLKISEILSENKKNFKFTNKVKKHLFTGLIICDDCHRNAVYTSSKYNY